MQSSVCQRSPDFLDLCSNVLQDKARDSRGNITKHALTFLISEYNWSCFTTAEGRGNVHANTAASIDTEQHWFALDNRFRSSRKTGLHPTTDSAPRPTVPMVANFFNS